jgi:hypothetical protein
LSGEEEAEPLLSPPTIISMIQGCRCYFATRSRGVSPKIS